MSPRKLGFSITRKQETPLALLRKCEEYISHVEINLAGNLSLRLLKDLSRTIRKLQMAEPKKKTVPVELNEAYMFRQFTRKYFGETVAAINENMAEPSEAYRAAYGAWRAACEFMRNNDILTLKCDPNEALKENFKTIQSMTRPGNLVEKTR